MLARTSAVLAALALAALAAADTLNIAPAVVANSQSSGSGWVVTTGSGTISINTQRFAGAPNERRGILEYSLAAIPDTADVLSASITIDISFYNLPPTPNIQFNGYAGDGSASPADPANPLNSVGTTGGISTLNFITVPLSTSYIETLLTGGASHLGLYTYMIPEGGGAGFFAGTNTPTLDIEYVPEPASLLLVAAAALFRRR